MSNLFDLIAAERSELHHATERRHMPFVDAEIRMEPGSGGLLNFRGMASVYEASYEVTDRFGTYVETPRRGCFDKTLAENCDTIFTVNHGGDSAAPLARTRSGTLTLRSDDRGLVAEARIDPSNPRVQELRSAVSRGDLDSMSFVFRDMRPTWSSDYSERSLTELSLHHGDVSVVSFPASEATTGTVDLRNRQQRAKYSQSQINAAGKKHMAFRNPDGHYSFPVLDKEDLLNAIRAVGRSGASHNAVRKFIIARAKAMGLASQIPSNWAADGSLKQQSNALKDYSAEARRIIAKHSRASSTLCPGCSHHLNAHGSDGVCAMTNCQCMTADVAESDTEDPTLTMSTSSSLSAKRPGLNRRAAVHSPFRGTHTHPHSTMGDPDEPPHSHSHQHGTDGTPDANHDHHTTTAANPSDSDWDVGDDPLPSPSRSLLDYSQEARLAILRLRGRPQAQASRSVAVAQKRILTPPEQWEQRIRERRISTQQKHRDRWLATLRQPYRQPPRDS